MFRIYTWILANDIKVWSDAGSKKMNNGLNLMYLNTSDTHNDEIKISFIQTKPFGKHNGLGCSESTYFPKKNRYLKAVSAIFSGKLPVFF